ncbi:MAG: helix-turn-helix transcriptional regulator [Eubacteriales bacterium]|nr:helix-turn-helix transcriptional regulator [Eubacteriales bacterium]
MSTGLLVSFGKAVRQMRQEKCISQEDFADMCGLHRTYISDVELGKRNISLENIGKIASALNIEIAHLFQLADTNFNSGS